MSSFLSVLKGIFSGDTLVLVIVFAVFFAYSMFLSKSRIVSLILSFYPAVILFNTFPFVNKLLVMQGDKLSTLNKIGVFLLFLIPLTIIINRYVISESMRGTTHLFRTAGLALCATILVLIFSYSTVSLDALYNFSPQIDSLFTGLDRIFYWNIGVLALLAFL